MGKKNIAVMFAKLAKSLLGNVESEEERSKRKAELAMGIYHRMFGRVKKGTGRRATMGRRAYQFMPRYVALTGTGRHCYYHPKREAEMMMVNGYDRSYRVPICRFCVKEDK